MLAAVAAGRGLTRQEVARMRTGWKREDGVVREVREVAAGCFRLEVMAPWVASRARPGQFAMLRPPGYTPFLARPLSFFAIDAEVGTVAFLVGVMGEGTRKLVTLRPGDRIGILGPLGRGFPPTQEVFAASQGSQRGLWLVAGGVGVAPFPPVVREARSVGVTVRALVGARERTRLAAVGDLRAEGAEVEVCTEDVSWGRPGQVTELLREYLDDGAWPGAIYACGPAAMLARVAELVGSIPLYVSVEQRMGCGFGACRGCAVPARKGEYLHACQDGPVFDAHRLDLGALAAEGGMRDEWL